MSADMEFILLKIILYCVIEDPKEAIRKFKKMTMGSKINWAKKDLANYKPEEYEKNKDYLKELEDINNLRIDLAHNNIQWDVNNQDASFVDFVYMDFINNQHRLLTRRRTVEEINKTIWRFRELLIKFEILSHFIEDEFLSKYPDFRRSPKT